MPIEYFSKRRWSSPVRAHGLMTPTRSSARNQESQYGPRFGSNALLPPTSDRMRVSCRYDEPARSAGSLPEYRTCLA